MPMDLPAQHIEQQAQQQQQQIFAIPYDTRPMEGPLRPGEKIVLHGGIMIANHTDEEVFIREDFLLYKGGYHITVIHPPTGNVLISGQQSPMNAGYLFIIIDGQPVLEKVERNNS